MRVYPSFKFFRYSTFLRTYFVAGTIVEQHTSARQGHCSLWDSIFELGMNLRIIHNRKSKKISKKKQIFNKFNENENIKTNI